MFNRNKHSGRRGMTVVLSEAVIEHSIKIRRLVDELESDTQELKNLIAEEREGVQDGE